MQRRDAKGNARTTEDVADNRNPVNRRRASKMKGEAEDGEDEARNR